MAADFHSSASLINADAAFVAAAKNIAIRKGNEQRSNSGGNGSSSGGGSGDIDYDVALLMPEVTSLSTPIAPECKEGIEGEGGAGSVVAGGGSVDGIGSVVSCLGSAASVGSVDSVGSGGSHCSIGSSGSIGSFASGSSFGSIGSNGSAGSGDIVGRGGSFYSVGSYDTSKCPPIPIPGKISNCHPQITPITATYPTQSLRSNHYKK